ncbi:hypothetical protein DPMN_143017 [Dreissena polymorpha]|uniref:Uncharacterized protein n=1 Tax=Dreissena polymorpha TaxID=45954 RepID=A0A9D4GGF0_DREPO|nr:hypothetical protein DPMN_143017 [Dreissena polymorpha]
MFHNCKVIIFKQLNVIDGRWGRPVCTLGIDGDQFIQTVKAQSHYDAGGAPVRDPASTGMNRGSTRMNRGSNGRAWKCLIPSG